jgi:2-isopropylmalate synthase
VPELGFWKYNGASKARPSFLSSHDPSRLIFDWSAFGPERFVASGPIAVNDETLRDGLQSPSVTDPPIASKLEILHRMDELGIECASMGIPAAGSRQQADATRLCREIADRRLSLRPNLGGRTLAADIELIVEVAQASGMEIEACLFIGSSPIRHYAEDWDVDRVLGHSREAVAFAVAEGLRVNYITEDTARSSPQHLELLIAAAVDAGAARVCLCDTVGAAIPQGVRNLVGWVRELLRDKGVDVGIDWHGHRDRGLGLANTLAAIEAGADRVHSTVLGIGERVGNTATEEVLVNLQLLGLGDRDLSKLPALVETVAAALGVAIPASQPIVGRDAFRTASGVHAAAVAKAQRRGETWVEDRVYSGVPASWLGRRQEIEIGPLSGSSNVTHFLRMHGLAVDSERIARVLETAKASQRVLTEREVLDALDAAETRR